MESQDGMILTGENQRAWRKTCPNAALSTTNPAWTDLYVNLGLHSDRLSTNRLSHGMAYNWFSNWSDFTATQCTEKDGSYIKKESTLLA
jgi:hypothetical protein